MRPILIALLLSLFVVTTASASQVRLSAAASMTEAVKELIAAYGKRGEGIDFLPNFGSSGALAKQIAQGAPADLFISANPRWMTYLVEEGRIPSHKIRNFAFNALVFVGRENPAVGSLVDLAGLRRIALGSPRSVPAGQYAEQALKAAGLYERLAGRLVIAKDVRHALVYADRGEVDGAFVYRTDALLAREAVILLEVPPSLYDRVTYPVGLTLEGVRNPKAVAFYDYLLSGEAADILKRYGFAVR